MLSRSRHSSSQEEWQDCQISLFCLLLPCPTAYHYLLGIHDSTYTDCESGLWNQIYVIVEETAVSNDGIGGQGLLTGTALKTGSWFVEGNMSIGTNTAHEEVNTTCILDSLLVILTLDLQILGVTIEDMDILFLNVDVAEEIVPHEGVVTLGMIFGEIDIFEKSLLLWRRHNLFPEGSYQFLVFLFLSFRITIVLTDDGAPEADQLRGP